MQGETELNAKKFFVCFLTIKINGFVMSLTLS